MENVEKVCQNGNSGRVSEACWKRLDEIDNYLMHEEDVRKGLMRLDVYFQSMTTTLIKEEPKYSVIDSVKLFTFSLDVIGLAKQDHFSSLFCSATSSFPTSEEASLWSLAFHWACFSNFLSS